MKMSFEQEMRLNNVTKADLEWRTAKVEMAAIAKRYAEERIGHISYERDRAVRLAIEAGVPKRALTQRHQGLHTTDPGTINASLQRTAEVAETLAAEEIDPFAKRYSIHDGMLKVTLDADELAKAKYNVNYDDKAAPAPTSALFAFKPGRNGGLMLDPVFGTEVEGTFERHPVVYWAFDHEAEALAWYAEHCDAQAVAA